MFDEMIRKMCPKTCQTIEKVNNMTNKTTAATTDSTKPVSFKGHTGGYTSYDDWEDDKYDKFDHWSSYKYQGEQPAVAFLVKQSHQQKPVAFYGAGGDMITYNTLFYNEIDLIINASGTSVLARLKTDRDHTHVLAGPSWIPNDLRKENPFGSDMVPPDEIVLSWRDMGVPNYPQELWELILSKLGTKYKNILCCCVGGHGRTGTMLSILHSAMNGIPPIQAIDQIRETYCEKSVETNSQTKYVINTACDLNENLDREAALYYWDLAEKKYMAKMRREAAERIARDDQRRTNLLIEKMEREEKKEERKEKIAAKRAEIAARDSKAKAKTPAKSKAKTKTPAKSRSGKKTTTKKKAGKPSNAEKAMQDYGNVLLQFRHEGKDVLGYVYDVRLRQAEDDKLIFQGMFDWHEAEKFLDWEKNASVFSIALDASHYMTIYSNFESDLADEDAQLARLEFLDGYIASLFKTYTTINHKSFKRSLHTGSDVLYTVLRDRAGEDGLGEWVLPDSSIVMITDRILRHFLHNTVEGDNSEHGCVNIYRARSK